MHLHNGVLPVNYQTSANCRDSSTVTLHSFHDELRQGKELFTWPHTSFFRLGSLPAAVLHFAVSHHAQPDRTPGWPAVYQGQADQLLAHCFESQHAAQSAPKTGDHS